MQLAIFDLDGTITRHDTLVPYVLGFLSAPPVARCSGCLPCCPAVLRFALDRIAAS